MKLITVISILSLFSLPSFAAQAEKQLNKAENYFDMSPEQIKTNQQCHNNKLLKCRRSYYKRFINEGQSRKQAIESAVRQDMDNCPNLNSRRKEECGLGEPNLGLKPTQSDNCLEDHKNMCYNGYLNRFLILENKTIEEAQREAGSKNIKDNCPTLYQKSQNSCNKDGSYKNEAEQISTEALEAGKCKWKPGFYPRKVTSVQACGTNQAATLCVGYIVCNKDGEEMERLATCGAENCSLDKADECAKQVNYYSRPVTESDSWWKKVESVGGNNGRAE